MGIGTLIIFIATILVAAVAAGVLISTSGVLQQRALITGQEARKKITNSVEVIQITADGNKTTEEMNDFEILVRLNAGSDPLQMKKFDLSWIGPDNDAAAQLQHPDLNDPDEDPNGFAVSVGTVDNESWTYIRDLDGDNKLDKVRVWSKPKNSTDMSSVGVIDVLIFNFTSSSAGNYIYNLSQDISAITNITPIEFEIENEPIMGSHGLYYGYFNLVGNVTVNNTISGSGAGLSFNLTAHPSTQCSFDTLAPETKYCFIVQHGDNDLVLNDGETFKILYKLRPQYAMSVGQDFKFIFSPEKGNLAYAQAKTPDVVTTTKVTLWPVG